MTDPFNNFDYRSRSIGKRWWWLYFYGTDPQSGSGTRKPRQRTLFVGPWRFTWSRDRRWPLDKKDRL